MNYLKRVLCKWFLDNNKHKEVTVGSFAIRLAVYIAIIHAVTYAPFHELSNVTNDVFNKLSLNQIILVLFQDLSIITGYAIYIIIAFIAIIKIWYYIKDIQIYKCEK